jgi:Domain of unknown function (DUF4365)
VTTKKAWYIGQRAESLALMYLTRRNDLIVSRQQENYGLDFLITVSKDRSYSGRLFGVQVKATASTPKSIQGDEIVEIKLNITPIEYFTELPFPVCLFFFTLDNDHGYYKWILEPIIEEKYPKLHWNLSNEFKQLTDEEIDKIISAVNRWYDNRK